MKRIHTFDYIKGLCILIVVLCHTVTFGGMVCTQLCWLFQSIFLNDFYLLAGWIQARKDLCSGKIPVREEVQRKITALLIPYCMLSVIAIVFQGILTLCFHNAYISPSYTGFMLTIRNIYLTVTLNGIGTLWFLPILLIASVFLVWIRSKPKTVIATFAVGAYLLYCLISQYDTAQVPTLLEKEIEFFSRVCVAIAYSLCGYLLGLYWKRTKAFAIAGILFCVGGLLIFEEATFAAVPLVAIGFPLVCLIFEPLLENRRNLGLLEFCGEHSILIMYIHYIVVLPVVQQVLEQQSGFAAQTLMVQRWLLFLIVTVITLLLSFVVLRNKYLAFCFGKGELYQSVQRKLQNRYGVMRGKN